jgi:hypothetical protein
MKSTLKKEPTIKGTERKLRRLKLSIGKTRATDVEAFERLSRQISEMEQTLQELQVNQRAKEMTKKDTLKRIEKLTAAGTEMTLPDGKKVLRPPEFVPTGKENVFADPSVKEYFIGSEVLQPFIDSGDYIAIFAGAEEGIQAVAIPVLFNDIQSARSQRFRLLELNKQISEDQILTLQANIIRTAVEGIDKRVKAPKSVIKKYMAAFMESRNERTIASDLLFITKLY